MAPSTLQAALTRATRWWLATSTAASWLEINEPGATTEPLMTVFGGTTAGSATSRSAMQKVPQNHDVKCSMGAQQLPISHSSRCWSPDGHLGCVHILECGVLGSVALHVLTRTLPQHRQLGSTYPVLAGPRAQHSCQHGVTGGRQVVCAAQELQCWPAICCPWLALHSLKQVCPRTT